MIWICNGKYHSSADAEMRDNMSGRTFIIAEAGVNHNGSLDMALKLVEIAAQAGADAVKFQTFKANSLVSKQAPKADYQLKTTSANESQFEMLRKLELTDVMHEAIIEHCKKCNIAFMSTPFDVESLHYLVTSTIFLILRSHPVRLRMLSFCFMQRALVNASSCQRG